MPGSALKTSTSMPSSPHMVMKTSLSPSARQASMQALTAVKLHGRAHQRCDQVQTPPPMMGSLPSLRWKAIILR